MKREINKILCAREKKLSFYEGFSKFICKAWSTYAGKRLKKENIQDPTSPHVQRYFTCVPNSDSANQIVEIIATGYIVYIYQSK